MSHLFRLAADRASGYRRSLPDRLVGASIDQGALLDAFSGPLPSAPSPPEQVLTDLLAAAEPGLVASAGPRYFGFVVGGALPAATAADILAAGWDQNAHNAVTSPAAIAAEAAAGAWLKELLGIPPSASVGFVTGCQAANTVGLAAARHQVLADVG
jgi:glutamate/tyrosine decarboxylase-like PLP-dependent enzyme